MQLGSKVPGCSPERKTSIWTRPAIESDRIDYFFTRTRNSAFSRHRSNVSSSCCPKQWQPIKKISLARRSTVEDRSLQLYTTRFCGEEPAELCKYALHQMEKYNAKDDENLVKAVQQNFYMNDFIKSTRTPQEAIEVYQKVREILSKVGFNFRKWIASHEEVNSQVPEADRSTKTVKTFDAKPQLLSIFGLIWNVDTESLIVCRGTEQEVPAKNSENCPILCLSSVRPTWDMFTLHDKNAFSARKRLGSNGTSREKDLSAEHSKLFSDWCSELREEKTMSKNQHYFRKGCTNLGLHIFTDASEKAMCFVAYLQGEAMLKLTYVIGKCCVAPIRSTMILKLELPAAVYGVRLRKQILREQDLRIDKIYH